MSEEQLGKTGGKYVSTIEQDLFRVLLINGLPLFLILCFGLCALEIAEEWARKEAEKEKKAREVVE